MTTTGNVKTVDHEFINREEKLFQRWAGRCGIAASVAYITTIAATGLLGSVEPYDGPNDVGRYFQDVADNSARPLTYGIAGIVMCLLFLPLGVATYHLLKRTAIAGLGSLAMIVGLLALIPAYAVAILEGTVLASAADDVGGDALFVTAEAAQGVLTISFTVGSLLTLCVSPLLWAIDARRTGSLSTWLTRTGMFVGITGLIWTVWFIETGAVLAVLLPHVIASIVFFIGLSIKLLNGDRVEPQPPAAATAPVVA
jgi:hypothetical protein